MSEFDNDEEYVVHSWAEQQQPAAPDQHQPRVIPDQQQPLRVPVIQPVPAPAEGTPRASPEPKSEDSDQFNTPPEPEPQSSPDQPPRVSPGQLGARTRSTRLRVTKGKHPSPPAVKPTRFPSSPSQVNLSSVCDLSNMPKVSIEDDPDYHYSSGASSSRTLSFDSADPDPTNRRSQRSRKQPVKFKDYHL